MNTNNSDEMDLFQLCRELFPDMGLSQHQLDNPTSEFVDLFYQQFRNKVYSIVFEVAKDLDPTEGKRYDADTIHSMVRFINFTISNVFRNVDTDVTFKLLHTPSGKLFKQHIQPLLKVLWSFEFEFTKIREMVSKRHFESKELLRKRQELDNLKQKLARNVSEIATNENKYADLQKNFEKVQMRFKKLVHQQDQGKLAAEKLKESVRTILEEHDHLQVLISNIKANIQNLSKRIVTEESYNVLLSLKENVKTICTELKNEEHSIQENLRGKNLDIENFNKINTQITELNILGQELISVHGQYSKQLVRRKGLYKEVQEIAEKAQQINSVIIQLKEKLKMLKENMQEANCKTSDLAERYSQKLFDLKECLMQEQENQEQQLHHKINLEKKRSDFNKSCMGVKNELDNLNILHKDLYQKAINIENRNTETLSNALSVILDVLKAHK